jgi:hypothetical protein
MTAVAKCHGSLIHPITASQTDGNALQPRKAYSLKEGKTAKKGSYDLEQHKYAI